LPVIFHRLLPRSRLKAVGHVTGQLCDYSVLTESWLIGYSVSVW
jgi:hypothetical protein